MGLVYPMFCMVLLTFIVGLATAYMRIKSAASGNINPKYFKLMSNYDVPEKIAQLGRNFDNLFQVPMLFYGACITSLALDFYGSFLTTMAWVFVALRFFHTAIHITYNHPLHRFAPFLLSFICVFAMWVQIMIRVAA